MIALPATRSGEQITRHGGPETLSYRTDIPVPVPGPGQVLTRALAAGVNNTDMNTQIGWYFSEITSATDVADRDVDAGGWGGALAFPRIQGGDLRPLASKTYLLAQIAKAQDDFKPKRHPGKLVLRPQAG